MLRVQIHVNFTPILDTHVVRVKGGSSPDDLNTYEMLDGRRFRHRYGDGAVELAIKMLKRIKEPK
jgi:hypothetical protein